MQLHPPDKFLSPPKTTAMSKRVMSKHGHLAV